MPYNPRSENLLIKLGYNPLDESKLRRNFFTETVRRELTRDGAAIELAKLIRHVNSLPNKYSYKKVSKAMSRDLEWLRTTAPISDDKSRPASLSSSQSKSTKELGTVSRSGRFSVPPPDLIGDWRDK